MIHGSAFGPFGRDVAAARMTSALVASALMVGEFIVYISPGEPPITLASPKSGSLTFSSGVIFRFASFRSPMNETGIVRSFPKSNNEVSRKGPILKNERNARSTKLRNPRSTLLVKKVPETVTLRRP